MKVRNLMDYPQQLGDGRVIGAVGTKEEMREYDLPELAKADKQRVKRDSLAIVEEEKPADKIVEPDTKPLPTANGLKGGNK